MTATGLFAGVVAFLLSIAVAGRGVAQQPEVQAALLWIAILFATTLGVGRAYAREQEGGAFTSLLLRPFDWSWIFAVKWLATTLWTTLAHLATLGVLVLLLQIGGLDLGTIAALIGLIALATAGHVACGLTVGALTVGLRAREVLLPVLLLPLLIPLYLAALSGTLLLLGGFVTAPSVAVGEADLQRWILALAAFAVTYGTAGFLLAPVTYR